MGGDGARMFLIVPRRSKCTIVGVSTIVLIVLIITITIIIMFEINFHFKMNNVDFLFHLVHQSFVPNLLCQVLTLSLIHI